MKQILETRRLCLREMNVDDAASLYELNSDPEVIKFTGDVAFKDHNQARDFLVNYSHYQKYGMGRWAIMIRNSTNFLGWCGLKYNQEINEVDLGYRLMKNFWGRGYATEAAIASVQYGFENFKLERIIGKTMTSNSASIRVLEKAGLSFEKFIWFDKKPGVLYSINRKV